MKFSHLSTSLAALQQGPFTVTHKGTGHRNMRESTRAELCRDWFGDVLTEGVWTSRGYGWTVDVYADKTCEFFEESEISCVPEPLMTEDQGLPGVGLVSADLAAVNFGKLNNILLDRTDEFQGGCANGATPVVGEAGYEADALMLFDIFDQIFVEHYTFFEVRDVDWDNITATARSALTSSSTDEELLGAIASCIAPLEDGHTFVVTSDGEVFQGEEFPILAQLQEEWIQQDEIDDLEEYVDTQMVTWLTTLVSYMDIGSYTGYGALGENDYSYGTFNGGATAYLQLTGMEPEDPESFFEAMDGLFTERFANSTSIIIDVRINGGGDDAIGFMLAGYFATEKTSALTKKAKYGDSFTESHESFVEPRDPIYRFKGSKVIIISSRSCVSACETFLMAMTQLPIVHAVVGRDSGGALSDVLPRALPNAWVLGLSNEEYRTPQGVLYEGIGIPATVKPDADLLPLVERKNGEDSWLEVALNLAATPTDSPTPTPSDSPTAAPTPEDGAHALHPLVAMSISLLLVFFSGFL